MISHNQQLLRYYCTKCNSILKESPSELSASSSDVCPCCGSFLTDTLAIEKGSKHRYQGAGIQLLSPVALRTAIDLSVPRFGISALDDLVGRFTTSLCLTGNSGAGISEALFWRALVRSMLPKRAGGSGFSKILLIDAGNCSDIYQCVDFARQLGLNLDKLLDGIVVTRAFTVHQLASLSREIGRAAKMFGADMVAVADAARMFADDPQVEGEEEENRIASVVSKSLAMASSQVPVMAFVSSSSSSHNRSKEWTARFDACIEATEGRDGRVMLSANYSGGAKRPSSATTAAITIPRQQVYFFKEG